jgi:hypothetical protein
MARFIIGPTTSRFIIGPKTFRFIIGPKTSRFIIDPTTSRFILYGNLRVDLHLLEQGLFLSFQRN